MYVNNGACAVRSFLTIFKTMLFSLFGIVELSDFIIDGYPSEVINAMSQIMFATFEWLMIIIILNILIARMSETYSDLAVSESINIFCCLYEII